MAFPVLVFRLSEPSVVPDVLRELAHHDGVVPRPDPSDPHVVHVELVGDLSRRWEVGAMVRLFDADAQEVS